MSGATRFIEIGCIEHEIICSEDNLVDNEFAEPEGSIEIYVTAACQWVTSDNNKVFDRLLLLGKIQSRVMKVYSVKLRYADLLNTTNKLRDLKSVLEQVLDSFHIPGELCNLELEIMKTIDKAATDIKIQKPREFEIEIFIEFLAKQVCSEQEFREKYAKLFRGTCNAALMRTIKFPKEEDVKEDTCCALCSERLLPGLDRVIIMPCSDVFHEMCIGGWLNGRSTSSPDCCWSPAEQLPESSSGLLQVKLMFDLIQDLVNSENKIPNCDAL